FREGLADVVIPSWIDRPPTNLGEKSHGKLKADNWFVLFIIFFPLIVPELWYHASSSRRDLKLLENLHDLVGATHILCSYATSPAEADLYNELYRSYLLSSKTLFPGLSTRPNHHYARHNGELLKWWGPLIKLGEFFFQSHNGRLQKIKTNNHMWELDLTMLRQMCRRGRLFAAISDSASAAESNSPVAEAMGILSNRDPISMDSRRPEQLSPAEETAFNGSGKVLEASVYELIFSYWNRTYSPSYIRPADLTYDLLDAGVNVFPSRAVQLTNFDHKARNYTTFKKHAGTSSISFRHPSTGRKDLGYIQSIWTQALQGQSRIFVIVLPHTDLSPIEAVKSPYPKCPGFAVTAKYSRPSQPQALLVVEPRHIISHVPFRMRRKGTYGIKCDFTLFVDSLNRGRD
ncbi:hypothetical protein DFH06DRAFT_1005217, partial [Mycena polygramma]